MRTLMLSLFLIFTTPLARAENRTLFFGDSHLVGAFGKQLNSLLRLDPTFGEVTTLGLCGTIASDFISGATTDCGSFLHVAGGEGMYSEKQKIQKISDIFDSFSPTRVIVELGSNYGDAEWNSKDIQNDMKKLVKLIRKSGAECVWVSMPDTLLYQSRQQMIVSATETGVKDVCRFIDSTKLTRYPTDFKDCDGLHYECGENSENLAKNWADNVFKRLNFK